MARVLIVDRDASVRDGLDAVLSAAGHACSLADGPERAREILAVSEFDLVLLEIDHPLATGSKILETVTSDAHDAAIVAMTAFDQADKAEAAVRNAVHGFVVKPFGPYEMELSVYNALKRRDLERERRALLLELQEKVSERSIALREVSVELARAMGKNELAERETWERLQAAVALRDDETGKHIERVGWIAKIVAERMELDASTAMHLGMAAALHDVGKIGIPDVLLLKPGALTPEERAIVQHHPAIGYRMLSGSRSPVLNLGATIALTHHERWDGGGYPRGLAGSAIPVEGRITSVVDAFDAMTHPRVYRLAHSVEGALEELTAQRGKQFDADVVDALAASMDDVEVILAEHPDEEETRIRVLLVGGEQMFSEALISFLAGKGDILVVGTAGTVEEAVRITRQLKPGVVVLDSALPEGTPLEATSLIKAERPSTNIVWLTGPDDARSLAEAIQAGCSGYLQRGEPLGNVVNAIRAVHAGESIVPRDKLPELLRAVTPSRRGLGSGISDREREVLLLLAEGLSTDEMSRGLVLSPHTVRNHIQRIIEKLHAHSRLEAVTTAVREGVIELRSPDRQGRARDS